MTKIYDTSSLLIKAEEIFNLDDKIVITNITLKELENIKTSINKDQSVKYAARQLLRQLNENSDKYTCIIYKPIFENWLRAHDIELNNDGKILATAYNYLQNHQNEKCIFYTNDLALKVIAEQFFGKDNVQSEQITDKYTGYIDIYFNVEEMANFYSNSKEFGQKLKLKINQYLNIYDTNTKERVDTLCWTENGFRPLKYKSFYSKQLGEIKPYKNDVYQAMVADSLLNNQITMIKGPAGAGKSHLAIGYLFYLLEKGKIDKIIIFCNTIATKNAAKLGSIKG